MSYLAEKFDKKIFCWPQSSCQTYLIYYLDKINFRKDLRLCCHQN